MARGRRPSRLDDAPQVTTGSALRNEERHLSGMVKAGIRLGRPGPDYDWVLDYPDQKYVEADLKEMLDRLSPRQVTYTVAMLCGLTTQQAAKQISVDPIQTLMWEEAPWFPALLRQERDRMFGFKKGAFEPLTPLAAMRLEEELLGMHGDDIAHDAAKYVLDQRFGKASPTTPTGETAAPEEAGVGGAAVAFVELVRAAQLETQRALEERRLALTAEVREVSNEDGDTDDNADPDAAD